MKQLRIFIGFVLSTSIALTAQNTFENKFQRPLGEVLTEIGERFHVKLKFNIDTAGLSLPYADSRIRPYSVEESLRNALAPFDYKFVKQGKNTYKLMPYEYYRRTSEDGAKLLEWLSSLYSDKKSWESRRDSVMRETRELLEIDEALSKRVGAKPLISSARKFDGYTVRNFYLETHPGLYVCGSIYEPSGKRGTHPLIICPNGHFSNGRYNESQQLRLATLARMGAICVDYDLYGWGESALQVGADDHYTSKAQVIQAMNGISILDFMIERKDVDPQRVGVNGGSGGGSQAVLLSVIDSRYTAACPVVSLASHFDGGCPCESGMPIMRAGGGTCNAELAAAFAPRKLCVVSDGKDWTSSVPELEFPYLKRIYGFYDAAGNVANVHLPDEGHDFGPGKRQAVYDFFIDAFGLDVTKLDESRVTIEAAEALKSFGRNGEKMPANAIRYRK